MAQGKAGTTSHRRKTQLSHHGARDMAYIKPPKFRNHVTITELSRIVNRDTRRIRQLEKEGRIPEAVRVERGTLLIRLWSPAQVEEIKDIISKLRQGRPRNAK
jgi:hypothetical protein